MIIILSDTALFGGWCQQKGSRNAAKPLLQTTCTVTMVMVLVIKFLFFRTSLFHFCVQMASKFSQNVQI